MRVLLDLRSLTFDDHIDFEDAAGVSVTEAIGAMTKQRSTLRQQRALVWIFTRHFDRTFTLEDAGAIPVLSVEWEIPKRADDEGGD